MRTGTWSALHEAPGLKLYELEVRACVMAQDNVPRGCLSQTTLFLVHCALQRNSPVTSHKVPGELKEQRKRKNTTNTHVPCLLHIHTNAIHIGPLYFLHAFFALFHVTTFRCFTLMPCRVPHKVELHLSRSVMFRLFRHHRHGNDGKAAPTLATQKGTHVSFFLSHPFVCANHAQVHD